MIRAVEAVVDEQGNVHLLESVKLEGARRAFVMILDDPADASAHESSLLSEPALAQDWPSKPVKFVVPFHKFHAELVKALNQPDLRKTLTEQLGMDLVQSTPEALQKFLVGEIDRWGKVVRENDIRAD